MSISQIHQPIVRRTFLIAIWPIWALFILVVCALYAVVEVWPKIVEATSDGWEGPKS
jgi:hypothetical protein